MTSQGRLHVAVDLRIVDPPGMEMTGIGRYALEMSRALQLARPGWQFSLMTNRTDLDLGTPSAKLVSTRFPTTKAIGRILWLHVGSAIALRNKPDIWFSPAFVLPLWWRGASMVTVHDLTFVMLRERYRGRMNALYASIATRWSTRHADSVLCVSGATRDLLLAHVSLEPGSVQVIPCGVADVFFSPFSEVSQRPDVHPYVLFVGTREARKGLGTLHSAARRVNSESQRVRIVLAGQDGWGTDDVLRQMRVDPAVEFLEKPSDAELLSLYRNALTLVYPSEMEGFGLPVAEAMACGCAVVASDLPSVREFAAEYPRYFRPGYSDALAAHIEDLLVDGGTQQAERKRYGQQLASRLRWPLIGDQAAATIEQAVAPRARTQ